MQPTQSLQIHWILDSGAGLRDCVQGRSHPLALNDYRDEALFERGNFIADSMRDIPIVEDIRV